MPDDREVETIRLIAEALDSLDESAARRVYRWLTDRYARLERASESAQTPAEDTLPVPAIAGARRLGDLEALYAAAKATAQWERALITGYWLQEVQHREDFDAQAVNQTMRECGYGISNITRELSKLTAGGLVVQQPLGNSNGRRRFRLSRDGLRWCRGRLGQAET